jgi:hypothetical protein
MEPMSIHTAFIKAIEEAAHMAPTPKRAPAGKVA